MRNPVCTKLAFSLLLAAAVMTSGCRMAVKSEATDEWGGAKLSAPALPSQFLVRLWQTPGQFDRTRVATLIGNTLYLAGTPRGVAAINTETGFPRWVQAGRYVVDADMTVCGDSLIYSEGGRLVSRDKTNGAELLRVTTRLGTISPIYATENSWVFAAGNDQVFAVTPGSGLKAGHVTLDAAALESAWDGDDLAYFLTTSGTLYAVSISVQSLAWECHFRKPFCSPPCVAGNLIFVGCQDYFLYAVDSKTGQVIWQISVSSPALEKPVVALGRVYLRTVDGVLHAIDIATQKELWAAPNGGQVLTATKDHLILLKREPVGNTLIVADAANGRALATATATRYDLFRANPESGIVYAIAQNGETLAIADKAVVADK